MDTASTAAVLLLNLEAKALGGIDLLSFTTTPRFQGIKNLPPGFHFVFTGTTSTLSLRYGSWFHVKPPTSADQPQLFIRKWDLASEELLDETSQSEILRWRANLGSIWREGLTPYRQTASKDTEEVKESNDWVQLSDCVTEALLSRIVGATPDHWSLTSSSSAARDLDDIPGLSREQSRILPEKELNFLPVDLRQTWRSGATGRERTEAAQDWSWALVEMVKSHCTDGQWDEVLGELQFCFLMVLTLNNYSCLEQWRRILQFIFTCKAAVNERPDFFVRAIATLRLQLQHSSDVEGGLFDFEDEGGTFLKRLLVRFGKGMESLPGVAKQDVMDELDDLQEFLTKTYGWQWEGSFARSGVLELEDGEQVDMDITAYDEEDEEGEYAPQIVDLSPEQLRILGAEQMLPKEKPMTPLPRRPKREEMVHEVEENENDHEPLYEEEDGLDIEEMDGRY